MKNVRHKSGKGVRSAHNFESFWGPEIYRDLERAQTKQSFIPPKIASNYARVSLNQGCRGCPVLFPPPSLPARNYRPICSGNRHCQGLKVLGASLPKPLGDWNFQARHLSCSGLTSAFSMHLIHPLPRFRFQQASLLSQRTFSENVETEKNSVFMREL